MTTNERSIYETGVVRGVAIGLLVGIVYTALLFDVFRWLESMR